MKPLLSGHREGFGPGYTPVAAEPLEFGILRLREGEKFGGTQAGETAWILLDGAAELSFSAVSGGSGGSTRADVARDSVFDEGPSALSLPSGAELELRAVSSRGAEWAVCRTPDGAAFKPRLFGPAETLREQRGKGLVQGACQREVRTIFDHERHPQSALVIGEVVNRAGRWSSYPPHHHAQPELYHYRFTLPQGYGHAECGDEVFKVRSHDTLCIPGGADHAQVSAPGYGMYYLWVVRHLARDPYTGFTFTEDHRWTLDPAKQGWEPK